MMKMINQSMSSSSSCVIITSTDLFIKDPSSSSSSSSSYPYATLKPPTSHNRHQYSSSKCQLSKRGFLLKGVVSSITASAAAASDSALGSGPGVMERLPYKPDGYNFWSWRDHQIHYVQQGSHGTPVVLIHGFGASAFHWRYNIPELAKSHRVYALDLLGFGWSDKALVEYDALIWRDQVVDFINQIVKEPAFLVGNSLGGFTALVAAEGLADQVLGVALLNSAGKFGEATNQINEEPEETTVQKFIFKPLKDLFQRAVLGFVFWQSKQPARIESVLKSVYVNKANVDDYLVQSIIRPATDPNAGEVYYRLMSRFMLNQNKYTLNSVLSKLSCPLLLVWGDLDPWVGPAKANSINEFYPNSSVVHLQAGHCPHDEVPELVNTALLDWLSTLKPQPSLQTL